MYYLKIITILLISALFTACTNKDSKTDQLNNKQIENLASDTIEYENKAHKLIHLMSQKTGSYEDLLNLKNVTFTYTYRTPDLKEDISIESYIFDGELSHGEYLKHERTLPGLNGKMQQAFNGEDFSLTIDGKKIKDSNILKDVAFTRKTNFYWFAMMQKLLDPGINYEYMRQSNVEGTLYDVVKITFNKPDGVDSDTYQLYINPDTHVVDQFLFTVVSKNITDPILMRVTYENVQGVLIPTYRKYTKSDWEANVITNMWVEEVTENVKFNQNLDSKLFKI